MPPQSDSVRDAEEPELVKCLLVDDLEDNLFTMSLLLEGPGVQVLTARSGVEALELLLVHDVALALLDVQMPGMDGFELAELIRGSERTRHIPLIFVTAAAREDWRLFKGYDAGAVDVLFKPVEPWILRSKAQVFFELARGRQRLARDLRERSETLHFHELFSAVLAHDLRDPLNAMLTSAQLIALQPQGPSVQRAAGRILESGRGMARLISDILDVTRARMAGGIPLQPAPADLLAIADRVAQEQRAAHPGRALQLQGEGDTGGTRDAERLAQVIANLVGNALVHGAAGAPAELRVDGRAPERVIVEVESAGEIPAALRPHIFDPFRGSAHVRDRLAGRPAGLGLGLYIVRQIVLAHQGDVTVHADRPGHTRFCVSLPRHVSA